MRFILLFYGCLLAQLANAQITPDQIAYDHKYEEVLQKNNIAHSYWVVKKSDADLQPGDTLVRMSFNARGQLEKMRFTSPLADSEFLTEYRYTEDGKLKYLIQSTDYYSSETQFNYADGVCIATNTVSGDPEQSRYIIENGRAVERQIYLVSEAGTDLDGVAVPESETIIESYRYTYNEFGQCIGEVFYYLNQPVATTTYLYGNNALMQRYETVYTGDAAPTVYQQFVYNEQGLLKNVIASDHEGQVTYFNIVHQSK
jgi:hypothetical protein